MIKIDGSLLESYNERQLRKGMRVVPQQVHVFEGTLRDNLKFGDPNAADETLYKLLHDLELTHMAQSPAGLLDILPGAGGVRLTGGESRRLGVVRALLLLLDYPLSYRSGTDGSDYSNRWR